MNIIEAMQQRRSVRSFDGQYLSAAVIEELNAAIAAMSSPFGGSVTVRLRQFDLRGGYKPSTYGMIKGATDFFLLGIADNQDSALTAGFAFEQVVLKAWQMGLGTCWIAATFKGSDFDRGQTWPDGQQLRIISPVGVAASQTLKEKITRLSLRSANRKPFDTLFFYNDFETPVPADNRFRQPLEMMRLAPSSTNSQPWRALVVGNTVHFYYLDKSAASVLDCGIGFCHFAETERFNGHSGRFETAGDAPVSPKDWIYLRSYKAY